MSTAQNKTHSSFQGKPNYWLCWEVLCNIILALFFLQFLIYHGSNFVEGLRLSTLLIVLKVSADVAFHLVRAPAKQVSTNLWDWFIGIAGAFTLLLFRPVSGADMWIGTGIQLCGMALQVAGMYSLNRSIGFVAANRGVKTTGMYRFVRHPLYFAYVVAFFGYMLNHFTAWNIGVYCLLVLGLYLRTRCEEGVLSQDEKYREYKSRVKYRMIPGIF